MASADDEDPTPEELEAIRRVGARFRERELAAQRKAAPLVAEALRVWTRDEKEIRAFLREGLPEPGADEYSASDHDERTGRPSEAPVLLHPEVDPPKEWIDHVAPYRALSSRRRQLASLYSVRSA